MGIFAMRARRPTDHPGAREELSEVQRQALPPHFEAVGEALASGSGSVDACAVLGRELAGSGVGLDEALAGLETTSVLVCGRPPGLAEARSLAVSWGDATLAYLHQLSCEDPLTGLASLAHLRGRVADLYRGEHRQRVPVPESHALVLLEAVGRPDERRTAPIDDLARALQVGSLGSAARTVFAGSETIGRVGPVRVAVVTGRDRLGPRVGLLRRLLADRSPVRIWIEGLPGTDAAAGLLLDELARA